VGFAKQNADEVEKENMMRNNGCMHNLHRISHAVTASPQGEAGKKTFMSSK